MKREDEGEDIRFMHDKNGDFLKNINHSFMDASPIQNNFDDEMRNQQQSFYNRSPLDA